MPREASHTRTHGPRVHVCLRHSMYLSFLASTLYVCERVCTHCVGSLIRGLIGRAGAIKCQTGRERMKKLRRATYIAAVAGLFDGKQSDSTARAAGNFIRCSCTTPMLCLSLSLPFSLAAKSIVVPRMAQWIHTGTLGILPSAVRRMTARGNVGVSSSPEAPTAVSGPYNARSSSPGQIRLLRTWGRASFASFAFLEDARSSSPTDL